MRQPPRVVLGLVQVPAVTHQSTAITCLNIAATVAGPAQAFDGRIVAAAGKVALARGGQDELFPLVRVQQQDLRRRLDDAALGDVLGLSRFAGGAWFWWHKFG